MTTKFVMTCIWYLHTCGQNVLNIVVRSTSVTSYYTFTGGPKSSGSLATQPGPTAIPTTKTVTPPITQATNPPATTSTPITTSKPSDNTKAPQPGLSSLTGGQPNTTQFAFGPLKTSQATKPTTSVPVTTSKPHDNAKAPQFGSGTPGTPASNTPPIFGPSTTFGANMPGLSTNPGTASFSPVSLPGGTKPGQTGLFQFRPQQTTPLSQSSSGLVSCFFYLVEVFYFT